MNFHTGHIFSMMLSSFGSGSGFGRSVFWTHHHLKYMANMQNNPNCKTFYVNWGSGSCNSLKSRPDVNCYLVRGYLQTTLTEFDPL